MISSPSDISQYQLLISDSYDVDVNQYNVLSEIFEFPPFDFPLNNEIMLKFEDQSTFHPQYKISQLEQLF